MTPFRQAARVRNSASRETVGALGVELVVGVFAAIKLDRLAGWSGSAFSATSCIGARERGGIFSDG